ncbi:MAG: hypothetical protein ACSHX6_00325 [Akkermansiaceae bacterium]
MSQALWMRLRDVAWSEYKTSTGTGERLPRLLQDASSRKIPRAIKANHMIWKLLCSGGIHHAAEPTIPFLIELSQLVTAEVKLEILDTLKSCTVSLLQIEEHNPWQQKTWTSLAKSLPLLRNMRNGGSEDIRISVETIIELLQKNSNEK